MNASMTASTDSLRQKTVDIARSHKTSWIQLGQCLFTVYKDKMYKSWGYLTFEAYCLKDLGIKNTMASKLLKSYGFLEKEEPQLAETGSNPESQEDPKKIPNYESVNLLRLARENKLFTPKDFSQLREAVIEQGKDPKEVKVQVKKILDERKPAQTKEQKEVKRQSKIRRLIGLIKAGVRDLEDDDLLPDHLAKQVDSLIQKLEDQIAD